VSEQEFSPCEKCGYQMYVGAYFCTRCGARVAGAAGIAATQVEQLPELSDVLQSWPAPEPEPNPPSATKEQKIDRMADYSREEVLRRVRLKQSLKRAGLAGLDLSGVNLEGVDLSRAELDGANLDGANLKGAVLQNASLRQASLKGANLGQANLQRADLTQANLEGASLVQADARYATLAGAELAAADLAEMRLGHAQCTTAHLSATTRVTFIDVSDEGDGTRRVEGDAARALLGGQPLPQTESTTRYFGKGDLLRDARLDFGAGSKIHIESRFENCAIALGEGAELVIGESGVLKNCEIAGHGNITVHGCFFERQSPGISGARSLVVSSLGAVSGAIQQALEPTAFAFEPGCRLRIKITQANLQLAAEAAE
jgi:hypothetical protein